MANIQFQVRRGTASEWTSANPILAEGEIGYVVDQNRLKVGDGITSWTGLAYLGSGELGGFAVSLSGLSDGNYLEFNQATETWVNRDKAGIVDGGNF